MIETKSGAKYIEQDPPMLGDPDLSRKIVDYLAYLKEQLNFVLATNGKNVARRVTFTALAEPGETVIDGQNITTGLITDKLGKNSWNLETGKFVITDGSIDITTSGSNDDKIVLRYGEYELSLSPGGIGVKLYDAHDHTQYRMVQIGSLAGMIRIVDTDGALCGMAMSRMWAGGKGFGGQNGQYEVYDADGKQRAVLDKNGLTFYDASGNVTNSYPA